MYHTIIRIYREIVRLANRANDCLLLNLRMEMHAVRVSYEWFCFM